MPGTATILGKDCKAYRNTGSYGSPTWNEIDNIVDLVLEMPRGETDATTRGSGEWEESEPTLIAAAVTWNMQWDPADLDFVAVRDAFLNRTALPMLILDGSSATTGKQGLRASMKIHDFSRNEALQEAVTVDVRARPARNADAVPAWHTVA